MFIIIGGDGKEYGPATADQIRAWITGGRANLDTRAKALGSDEWRRLGDFPEFSGPGETPPVMTTSTEIEAHASELADRGARLGAWFLDNIFAFLCCLPGFLLIGMSVIAGLIAGHMDVGDLPVSRLALGGSVLAIGGLVLLVVQVSMLTTRGQTVGKRLLGVRIVRHTDNSNPGFFSAVVMRALIPGLIGAVPYLGFLFTIVDICFIFRADRRCVHDLIAGTKVVRA